MNTLLSRRSILNSGLPAAASVTGSASSMTVRWFMAVSTRVILARSGNCASTRWDGAAARTNNKRIVNIGMSGTPLDEEKPGGRVATLDLLVLPVAFLGGTIVVNGGPLRNSFEHHVAVSDLPVSVSTRKRVDPAHVATVTKDIAIFCDL